MGNGPAVFSCFEFTAFGPCFEVSGESRDLGHLMDYLRIKYVPLANERHGWYIFGHDLPTVKPTKAVNICKYTIHGWYKFVFWRFFVDLLLCFLMDREDFLYMTLAYWRLTNNQAIFNRKKNMGMLWFIKTGQNCTPKKTRCFFGISWGTVFPIPVIRHFFWFNMLYHSLADVSKRPQLEKSIVLPSFQRQPSRIKWPLNFWCHLKLRTFWPCFTGWEP